MSTPYARLSVQTFPQLVLVLGEHFTPDNIPDADKLLAFPETGLHPRRIPIPTSGRVYTHSEVIVEEVGLEIAHGKRKKEDVSIEIHLPDGRYQIATYDDDGVLNNWPVGFFSP